MERRGTTISGQNQENLRAAPVVYNALRDRIVSLKLLPGCPISRVALQDEFGLSSTPVRDALLCLGEEGLVEIFPQRGTVVSPIDLSQAHQTQFLRRALEQEAARIIAETGATDLVQTLRRLIEEQQAAANAKCIDDFHKLDVKFHWYLFEATQALPLWDLLQRQSGHIDRIRRLQLPSEGKMCSIVEQHHAIVDGIESGNPAEAQGAVRLHLTVGVPEWDQLRDQFPDYFLQEG